MNICHYATPLGTARIEEEDGYITAVTVNDDILDFQSPQTPVLQAAVDQLSAYFDGKRQYFDLPLKQKGTTFQQEVWQALQNIKYGHSISYMQLSKQMGNVLAIRAIAAANGKNKLWIIVPCHRVIGSNGELTGYAGGLWRKQWLLQHEAKISGAGQLFINF